MGTKFKAENEVRVGQVYQDKDRRAGDRRLEVVGLTTGRMRYDPPGTRYALVQVTTDGIRMPDQTIRLDRLAQEKGYRLVSQD